MKTKTLQEQHNLIQEGRGHKGNFLKEAKRKFPSLITNSSTYELAEKILKDKSIINENYVDLQPINTFTRKKADFELAFDNFLQEEKKKAEVKVEEKKTSKEVEEIQSHGYDHSDKSNLDNQIGHEIKLGVRCEVNKDPEAPIEEIKKRVSKNLEKDPLYYKKNAAFGVEGIGYEEADVYEVSGKYKESGFSDKHKKLVKESLMAPYQSLREEEEKVEEESQDLDEGLVQKLQQWGTPEEVEMYMDSLNRSDDDVVGWSHDDFIEDFKNYIADKSLEEGDEEVKEEKPKKTRNKKMKKDSLQAKLKEIDEQGAVVTLEAKIEAISEEIARRTERLAMIDENSDLAELIDKRRLKEMQKDIKTLQKEQMRHEKMYEKLTKSPYVKQEIIDGDTDTVGEEAETVDTVGEDAQVEETYNEEVSEQDEDLQV